MSMYFLIHNCCYRVPEICAIFCNVTGHIVNLISLYDINVVVVVLVGCSNAIILHSQMILILQCEFNLEIICFLTLNREDKLRS